jgi:hypothetical protein
VTTATIVTATVIATTTTDRRALRPLRHGVTRFKAAAPIIKKVSVLFQCGRRCFSAVWLKKELLDSKRDEKEVFSCDDLRSKKKKAIKHLFLLSPHFFAFCCILILPEVAAVNLRVGESAMITYEKEISVQCTEAEIRQDFFTFLFAENFDFFCFLSGERES